MIVYKYFLKHVWRVKWSALLYILIFLIIAIASTKAGFEEKTFEETVPKIAFVRTGETEVEKRIEAYFGKTAQVRNSPKDEKQAKEMVFLGEADAVILFEEDVSGKLAEGKPAAKVLFDSKNETGYLVESRLQKYLMLMDATLEEGSYDFDRLEKVLKEKAKVSLIEPEGKRGVFSKIEKGLAGYFNFAGYILMAIYISVIGLVMSELQEKNVALRIDTSSKSTVAIQAQTYLAQFTLMLMLTFFLTLTAFVLTRGRLPIPRFGKYILNLMIFSFSVLGLTFMINNITNNRYVKNAFSVVFSLGTAMISGIMLPREFLGKNALRVARFFPTYYFVNANAAEPDQIRGFWVSGLIQLLFALVFAAAGLYFARMKREQGRY